MITVTTINNGNNDMMILDSFRIGCKDKSSSFPLYQCSVSAGFSSPVDDYLEKALDLNRLLIKHPASTFFVRVSGDSMTGVGIYENDVLIVDRSLTPKSRDIVIAVLNGELTVKRFQRENGYILLLPENPNFNPLKVSEEMNFSIWGVVTTVLHNVH